MPRHRPLGNKKWYILISKTFFLTLAFLPSWHIHVPTRADIPPPHSFGLPPPPLSPRHRHRRNLFPVKVKVRRKFKRYKIKMDLERNIMTRDDTKNCGCLHHANYAMHWTEVVSDVYMGISKWKWKFMRGKVKVYEKKRSWKEVLWCEMAAERLLAFARSCIKSENCQIFWQNISIGSHCIARCIGSMPSSHFFPVLLAHHLLKRSKKKLTNCHCHTFS